MLDDKDRIFTNLYGMHDRSLAGARARGHWDGTAEIIARGRDTIVEQMKASGLRGRGGAGFPTGLKWSFMPKQSDGRPSYLVINADESEPGTCKDREIMRHDPHTLIEGALIASFAMGANACYIYIRGEYIREREALQAALDECYDAGLLGKNAAKSGWDFDCYLHHGAGAYICGEETALLESLEGKKGMPRMKPPFPAGSGLYGCPTTVNNVESIAVVPTILRRGAGVVCGLWSPEQCGHQAVWHFGPCEQPVRGRRSHVDHPARVVGCALRRRARWLEEHQGGDPRRVFGADAERGAMRRCDHGFRLAARATLGSGHGGGDRDGSIDGCDQGDLAAVEILQARKSCGQCTPCREGTGWMMRVMDRLVRGEAEVEEIDMLLVGDQAGRRPHDLRLGRCGGLAHSGSGAAFP